MCETHVETFSIFHFTNHFVFLSPLKNKTPTFLTFITGEKKKISDNKIMSRLVSKILVFFPNPHFSSLVFNTKIKQALAIHCWVLFFQLRPWMILEKPVLFREESWSLAELPNWLAKLSHTDLLSDSHETLKHWKKVEAIWKHLFASQDLWW